MGITHLRNRLESAGEKVFRLYLEALESAGGRAFALYSEANNRHPALIPLIAFITAGIVERTFGAYVQEHVTGTTYIM